CACLISHFLTLIDDAADECHQDALCLIALYKRYAFFCCRCCAEDDCNARDISCYERYAQLTDHSVAEMSVARSLVRCCSVNIFQYLNKLCAESGSHA